MSDTIREAVHAQVEQKIASGEALHTAVESERNTRATLDEAIRATQAARRDALRSGWSESELKSLGLASTGARRKTRQPKPAQRSGDDGEQH